MRVLHLLEQVRHYCEACWSWQENHERGIDQDDNPSESCVRCVISDRYQSMMEQHPTVRMCFYIYLHVIACLQCLLQWNIRSVQPFVSS